MRQKRPYWLLLTGVLAGSLGISLVANIKLIQRGRHYERMFYLTRLDPLGYDLFAAEPPPQGMPGARRVVFFGDSRAASWPPPPLPDTQTVNRGIGGHSSAQALLRFDAHVAPLKPDIIVVQVGANDLVALTLLGHNRAQIVADLLDTIETIVAKSRGAGARVILTTIFPLARGLLPSTVVQQAIAEVNQRLLALAAPDVQVLDSAAVLAGPDGYTRPAYAEDEYHLSPAGYAALNEALAPLLGATR